MEEMQKGALLKPGEAHGFLIKTEKFGYQVIQEALGGDCTFEYAYFNKGVEDAGIDVCVDEEGKIKDLPPSAVIYDFENEIADVIAGPILFIGHDDEGASVGLSEEQLKYIQDNLCEFGIFTSQEDGSEIKLLIIRQ